MVLGDEDFSPDFCLVLAVVASFFGDFGDFGDCFCLTGDGEPFFDTGLEEESLLLLVIFRGFTGEVFGFGGSLSIWPGEACCQDFVGLFALAFPLDGLLDDGA